MAMTKPFEPRGVWPALATPFTDDGTLDMEAYERLLEFAIAGGVTGVVPCGTTGESPTLSWEEHEALVGAAIRVAAGKVGVLAGTGSNNTQEAIRGTDDARKAGASAALLVDCYYNGPSSLELRRDYYERVLKAVPEIPLVPYVIPGRSGCALGAEDLAMLHLNDPARVPAVKQATGDLDRMRYDRTLCGEGLAIMSGDDDLTLDDVERESTVCLIPEMDSPISSSLACREGVLTLVQFFLSSLPQQIWASEISSPSRNR
mgnify:CR=1 FL=1